jgi:hypothetical protein
VLGATGDGRGLESTQTRSALVRSHQLRRFNCLVRSFVLAHDWLFRLHGRWFRIPVSSFDAVHYSGMAIYKIGILLFFLVPLLALCVTAGA